MTYPRLAVLLCAGVALLAGAVLEAVCFVVVVVVLCLARPDVPSRL